MRIAVLVRGPVRPDMATVNARVHELRWTFESYGHSVHVFLASWTSQLPELTALTGPQHVMLHPDLERADIAPHTNVETLPLGASMLNAVRQYVLARAATRWISAVGDFDYVAHGRTDLYLGLGAHVPDWLVDDAYATIHTQHENAFLNDQFSVARPQLMADAWDCGDMAEVINALEKVDKPELVLQNNLEARGIEAVRRPVEVWQLDRRRHQ